MAGEAEELIQLIEKNMRGFELSPAANPDLRNLRKWKAFRESQRDVLASIAGWPAGKRYRVDSLPKRISLAWADYFFGDDPQFETADPADTEQLMDIVDENNLPSSLRKAADRCSSEGEIWYRIYKDPEQHPHPVVDFWSRRYVRPMWHGEKLLAVAFINDYGITRSKRWRLIEAHEKGLVLNVLFCENVREDDDRIATQDGDSMPKLGTRVPLQALDGTADLMPEFEHGLEGILAGRIVNDTNENFEIGVSDYDGIEDLLLDLNEAHNVDANNFKLAGRKRMVMNRKFAKGSQNAIEGKFEEDLDDDIYYTEGDDANEMDEANDPIRILEYEYDGVSSIARKDDLTNTALTRVGLARQLVDANANEGLAASGTALRTRLMPTVSAAKGKLREWADKLPTMLSMMVQLDSLEEGRGGFGRQYGKSEDLPVIVFANPLPVDDMEEATRLSTLVGSELMSMETALEEAHPDWDEDRLNLEIKRILANRQGLALDKEGNVVDVEVPEEEVPPPEDVPPEPAPEPDVPAGQGGAAA